MTEAPSKHAVHFEAVKVALNQTKDGYKLVLALHPDEVPEPVLRAFVGTRYMIAAVELDEDDTPKPLTRRPMDEGKRDAVWAAELCREPEFQRWLGVTDGLSYSEEHAANKLRELLDISSRAEIGTDEKVRERFRELAQSYLDRR